MTTTETKPLASREQLAGWLVNYDSDIDCRIRANAVLPGAARFVQELAAVRELLERIPTPEVFVLQTRAADDAEAALREATEALEAAQARFRRARADHDRATADAIRSRKPFAGLEFQLNACGNRQLALQMLEPELAERGITIQGDRLQFPEDSDWTRYKTP